MEKKNITIYDIAREANVSPATVSRVLTGNANVGEEKRKRVEELIDKYNFQPNALARSLFRKESKTIGFILPDITNPFFSSIFMEAEKYALNEGYIMMLCDSMNNHEIEYMHLKTLTEKQADAIIFMGGRVNQVKTNPKYAEEMNQILKRTPIIMINGKMSGVDCYNIVVDEAEGVGKLVDYLTSLGHKKIGMLGGKTTITSTAIKHKAFIKSLRKHGLSFNREWIVTEGFSMDSGFKSMIKLWSNEDRPTAVIGINDIVSLGIIKAAKSLGLRVPENISIAGFDGSYVSEMADPGLTTVSQNYEAIGRAVVDNVANIVAKKDTKKLKVIKPELIIRNSCLSL